MQNSQTPTCAVWSVSWLPSLLSLVVALAVLAQAVPTWGQFNVLLSPQVSTLQLKPGSRSGVQFELSNQDPESPVSVKVLVKDMVQGIMGEYRVSDTSTIYSCREWFALPPSTITIPAGEIGVVPVGIEVPYDARGGAYAAVVFEILDDKREARTGEGMPARVDYRFQIPAWVEIEVLRPRGSVRRLETGDLQTKLTKDDPVLSRRYGDQSLFFILSVQNTGNVHVFTEGRLLIRDEHKRLVKDTRLGAGRGAVLPGAISELQTLLPLPRSAGTYTAKAFVEYGGRSPAISQATLNISPQRTEVVGEQSRARPLYVEVNPNSYDESVPAAGFRVMGFTVHNREDVPVECRLTFGDLRIGREGQQWIEEDPSGGERSCVSWLSVDPMTFTLNPSRRQNVRVSVNVPDNAAGGYYGAIVVNSKATTDTLAATLPSPLYVPMFMTVPPKLTKSGEIVKIDTGPDVGGSITLLTDFRNTGNIHTVISGRVEVERWFNPGKGTSDIAVLDTGRYEDLATLLLETDSTYVLPGQTRLVTSQTLEGLTEGLYRARVIINYGGKAPATREKEFAIKESSPLQ